MFRHPVLENILCFFAGFVVVITMGTGSKQYNPQLFWSSPCLTFSLLQPLWGFSGNNKGARRHSPSLLLPHLLPQVLFSPLGFWGTWGINSPTFQRLKTSDPTLLLGTGAVRALWEASGGRTTPSSPISSTVSDSKTSSHQVLIQTLSSLLNKSDWSNCKPPSLSFQFDSQYLPPVHVIFLAAYYVLCRCINIK